MSSRATVVFSTDQLPKAICVKVAVAFTLATLGAWSTAIVSTRAHWICSWCWQSLTTVHRLDGCQRIQSHAVVFSTLSASYTFIVFIAITFSMLTWVSLRAALPCWRGTVRSWSCQTSGGSSGRSRSGCQAPPSFGVTGSSHAAVSSTGGVAGAVVHTTDQRAGAVIVRMAVSISKTTGSILCALRAAVSRVGYVPFAVVGATEETA